MSVITHAEMLRARKPMVVMTDGIGDQLMHWPAVRALGSLFPGRLGANVLPHLWEALREDLLLSSTFELPQSEDALLRHGPPKDLVGADLLLIMNDWDSSFLDALVRTVGARWTVGYDDCCSLRLPREFARNNIEISFDLPRSVDPDVNVQAFGGPIALPPGVESEAKAVRRLVPEGFKVLAVHAETCAAKNLLESTWIAVLDAFLQAHPDFAVFLIGRYLTKIPEKCRHGDRVISFAGVTLALSMGLLTTADLFLGIDSCMLHVADLQRIPGIGVFRRTDPRRWGFRYTRHEHVVIPPTETEATAVRSVCAALERAHAQAMRDRTAGFTGATK